MSTCIYLQMTRFATFKSLHWLPQVTRVIILRQAQFFTYLKIFYQLFALKQFDFRIIFYYRRYRTLYIPYYILQSYHWSINQWVLPSWTMNLEWESVTKMCLKFSDCKGIARNILKYMTSLCFVNYDLFICSINILSSSYYLNR